MIVPRLIDREQSEIHVLARAILRTGRQIELQSPVGQADLPAKRSQLVPRAASCGSQLEVRAPTGVGSNCLERIEVTEPFALDQEVIALDEAVDAATA